jgi:hypothetical protein
MGDASCSCFDSPALSGPVSQYFRGLKMHELPFDPQMLLLTSRACLVGILGQVTQPGFMSRFVICTVYLLCSGLGNGDERQSAPLTKTLYCTSALRASSRYAGETGTRKPQNREYGRYAGAPRTYTQPAQLFATEAHLVARTHPALRTGPMASAWRLLHVSRRLILDLASGRANGGR